MIMFIIAGRFLAKYDYYNHVKSQQEITELTLHYEMASFASFLFLVGGVASDIWLPTENR